MYSEQQRNLLLALAEESIHFHLTQGGQLEPEATDYEDELQQLRATFVTLHRNEALRGCIGTLEAVRPLVIDVAYNAYAAAFSDPRFPPLRLEEMQRLDIHISVLSPAEAVSFGSEQELVEQLQPGIDGLIIEEGRQRGTFLPSVWESLPQPTAFLTHLKLKAGLPADYWSDTIRVSRYTTESFGRTLS